jgi:biopolymer transport protein ExbD
MTPLLDVVFLLLTFFVFSLMLMVRADALGISLPTLGAAESAARQDNLTIALAEDGTLRLDAEPLALADLAARVTDARAARPNARLFIAADVRAPSGTLLEVIDALAGASITDFAIVGSASAPREGNPAGAGPTDEAAPSSP